MSYRGRPLGRLWSHGRRHCTSIAANDLVSPPDAVWAGQRRRVGRKPDRPETGLPRPDGSVARGTIELLHILLPNSMYVFTFSPLHPFLRCSRLSEEICVYLTFFFFPPSSFQALSRLCPLLRLIQMEISISAHLTEEKKALRRREKRPHVCVRKRRERSSCCCRHRRRRCFLSSKFARDFCTLRLMRARREGRNLRGFAASGLSHKALKCNSGKRRRHNKICVASIERLFRFNASVEKKGGMGTVELGFAPPPTQKKVLEVSSLPFFCQRIRRNIATSQMR